MHLLLAFAFSAMVNLLYLAPTLYMMQVYDRVVSTGGLFTLALMTLVALFALATLAWLDAMRSRVLIRAGVRLDNQLAGKILGRVLARSGMSSPSRVAQTMRDFDALRLVIAGPALIAFLDAPWTPVYILFAFILHPILGLLILAGGVAIGTLAVLNERSTKARLQKVGEATAAAYAAQEATASASEVVRALGMRRAMVSRQLADRKAARDLQAQAQFIGGRYSGAIKFLRLSLQSLALGVAAWLSVEKQVSAGAIIAASVLMSRALQPLELLVASWGPVVNARAAIKSLGELMSEPSPDERRTRLPPPKGRLRVEGVTLRAPGVERPLLNGVDLGIEPGQALGLIGPSGAGKTTLARIVAGALTPDEGLVRVDGADMRDWDPEKLAPYIGFMPQDSVLFAGSIRDNIARFSGYETGHMDEIDLRVVEAAKAAGAHEMILRFPRGYDSVLGPYGRGLSAGQAQRIALARALFGEPTILVLDEPNSHLDADGEAGLLTAIDAAKARGACVLLVAHRAGILGACDMLALLKDGEIEMSGSREKVAARLAARSNRLRPPEGAPKVVAVNNR